MFAVINADTGKVHARHTTKEKAEAQVRLLQAKDHDWQPKHRVKIRRLSDGTKVHVHFKGGRSGKAK